MCYACWRGFQGWCKSFTKTETLLFILESFLLVVFIGLLIFLILHFMACSNRHKDQVLITTIEGITTSQIETRVTDSSESTISDPTTLPDAQTIPSGHKCTWSPSQRTSAATNYYEYDSKTTTSSIKVITYPTVPFETTKPHVHKGNIQDIDDLAFADQSDGEDAQDTNKQVVLALVKMSPPRDLTFGCILTAVSEYWTLTAASCIEAIEEIDSLDSFVIMEGYGETRQGRTYAVSDVQVHPQYQGANRSYDLAALKTETELVGAKNVNLPTMVDYFLITIGERFTILGYGRFRTIDASPSGQRLREVYVYSLPLRQCPDPERDAWSPRHLVRGSPIAHAPCGTAPLCAGVLYSRGTPCNYCAGAPLLRAGTLLGVMADSRQCGVACEPALYVNIAVVRDWLDLIVDAD